jgi:hypothetical protein
MDVLATLGMALGSAWVSGINLYATVATLGLLQRFAGLQLPGDLPVLANEWVIGTAVFLYVVEFVADKVPYVDSVWDVVHTFIRVPAGAAVAASAFGDYSPAVQAVALLLGGSVALSSHGAKAATRAALNLSPEPASNVVASLIEDVVAIGSTVLAVVAPILMLIVVAVAVGVTIWLLPKIVRFARRTIATARGFFRRGSVAGGS